MSPSDTGFWIWAEALNILRNTGWGSDRYSALDVVYSLPCWEPAVDVYEQDDELHVLVALPGVDARQLEVSLGADCLVIHGQREIPANIQNATIRSLEIPYGRFERRIPLRPGEYRLRHQVVANGCLSLVLVAQ